MKDARNQRLCSPCDRNRGAHDNAADQEPREQQNIAYGSDLTKDAYLRESPRSDWRVPICTTTNGRVFVTGRTEAFAEDHAVGYFGRRSPALPIPSVWGPLREGSWNLQNAAGGAFIGILIIFLLVGAWAWMLVLFKKGPRALLGHEQVVVHPFENIVLYRRGVFDRILSPGVYWIWPKNRNLIRIDMRPTVLQIAQGLVTSDQLLANLRCMARIQVKDPKALIEGTQNYRDEVCARLQSVVREMGKQRTFKDLHLNQDEFNLTAQNLATQTIRDIGCECARFELLEAQSAGALTELKDKQVGFGPH